MARGLNKTFFQKHISPGATWVASWGYQNRNAVAWGIRNFAKMLNRREKFILKLALSKYGIILPKYRSSRLERIEHCHIIQKVTSTKLIKAAKEFEKYTGRLDFYLIIPEIVSEKVSGRLRFSSPRVNYDTILSTLKPRILEGIRRKPEDEKEWQSKLLDEAFKLASEKSGVDQKELLYRMQKMAGIGGDLRAVVASLFMDMPVKDLVDEFKSSGSEGLFRLSPSVRKLIQQYQYIRDNFDFDPAQIRHDKRFIHRKMSELILKVEMPKALLLFFLHKLSQARKAEPRSLRIFSQIRFLYAPLAERLGLIYLADDLRDQFLRLGNPVLHKFVLGKALKRIKVEDYDRAKDFLEFYVSELFSELQEKLGAKSLGIAIKFRVKSPYSIWNKVEKRGRCTYENIHDILGIKVICVSKPQLLEIREILRKSELFKVKGKIKEVLGEPEVEKGAEEIKWRGIKMIGEDKFGTPIEIQIMTQEMNQENNRGKAATWIYNLIKELGGKKEDGGIEQIFDPLEDKEGMSSNFVENFIEIRDHGVIAA